MNLKYLLEWSTKVLTDDKIKNPHLEAEILLSFILKKPREFVLSHPESKLTKLQIKNYKLQIQKRLAGMPIAYIIGEKEFYGLNFYVNKNVLIPRPETELMVDEALHIITHSTQHIAHNKTIIVDVGTGSGCILITVIKRIMNFQFPISPSTSPGTSNFQFVGIDINKKTLTIAQKNADQHKVSRRIKFINGNLLEPILKNILEIRNWKLVILANLPYLTPTQIRNSPTIKYEPKIALSAGKDGFKYYRQLFKQINKFQVSSFKFQVFCEIDPSQKFNFIKLAKKELPKMKIQTKNDLKGHSRLVILSSN